MYTRKPQEIEFCRPNMFRLDLFEYLFDISYSVYSLFHITGHISLISLCVCVSRYVCLCLYVCVSLCVGVYVKFLSEDSWISSEGSMKPALHGV